MRKIIKRLAVFGITILGGVAVAGCDKKTVTGGNNFGIFSPDSGQTDNGGSGENASSLAVSENDLPAGVQVDAAAIPVTAQGQAVAGTVSNAEEYGTITFTADGVSVTGAGVSIKSGAEGYENAHIAEIKESGTFVVSGTTADGFVAVAATKLTVKLILNGASITSANYSAIVCLKKSDVEIVLADGSVNYLTGGAEFVQGYDKDEEANAALCIRKELTMSGSGVLYVNGANNNGIGSKGDLIINGGTYYVSAANNAIKGNDSIVINSGRFYLFSAGDGIKSERDDDETGAVGNIEIKGGEFDIRAANDGVDCAYNLVIETATMRIITNGGYKTAVTDPDASAKGLKADNAVHIYGGNFDINANDDAVHSNSAVQIDGGTFTVTTADDGIHADENINITNGNINIAASYEGLEALNITISGGEINILSSDDGINISGGSDGSGVMSPMRPDRRSGGFGSGTVSGTLTISGGDITVNANGDGLDSNGNIVMTGGNLLVFGPAQSNNAALDFDGTFTISGGTLLAFDMGGMSQTPTANGQNLLAGQISMAAGTAVSLKNGDDTLASAALPKKARVIIFCSPALTKNTTTLYLDGGATYLYK